ncbi:MAG: helix-turn-helix domain-containing protein [Christensenellaceae bacterium]
MITAIRMKELRKESGLTQKELAQNLKIGQSSIVGYEQGTREPIASTLIAYANFFHVSVDYLLGREDEFGNVVVCGDPPLTKQEQELLQLFRSFPSEGRSAAVEMIKTLSSVLH